MAGRDAVLPSSEFFNMVEEGGQLHSLGKLSSDLEMMFLWRRRFQGEAKLLL